VKSAALGARPCCAADRDLEMLRRQSMGLVMSSHDPPRVSLGAMSSEPERKRARATAPEAGSAVLSTATDSDSGIEAQLAALQAVQDQVRTCVQSITTITALAITTRTRSFVAQSPATVTNESVSSCDVLHVVSFLPTAPL
jgi:hypothetical protein